jgi:A/G-specific adenine glycosylase
MQAEFFRRVLLNWHSQQHRPMPWKETKDPYKIWLSEIILQQTRVEQGLPYYQKFVEKYPTLKSLAEAKDDHVMRLWQGLGYYSRARNLLATARFIGENNNYNFPASYQNLLQLKGIGPYTAAAIASFAFDLPHAVLDGNVFRVLSRLFAIETPIDSTKGKKQFQTLADKLLDKKHAATYNQALMDFGATMCTPKQPKCNECVFATNCEALKLAVVNDLPIKEKRTKITKRYFNFFYITDGKKIIVQKRTEKDIWQNLFQLPLIETEQHFSTKKLFAPTTFDKHLLLQKLTATQKKKIVKGIAVQQQLSHQTLTIQFYLLQTKKLEVLNREGFELIEIKKIQQYAFPKSIAEFLLGLKEMVLF